MYTMSGIYQYLPFLQLYRLRGEVGLRVTLTFPCTIYFVYCTDERVDLTTLETFPHPSGDIKIMQEVVSRYKQLGNILLQSPNGDKVLGIEKSKHYAVNDVVYEIFRQWIKEDVDATWGKLVECLKNANLSPLAQKLSSCLV